MRAVLIDRLCELVFPVNRVAAAHRLVEHGRTRGKFVLEVVA